MADTAAHLVDCVLPIAPVRQWVLTLPYPLRYRCAWDAGLTSEVLRAFLRALFADMRRRARTHHAVKDGHCGAVTAIQRFGSALNLAPHFHSLVLDRVYPASKNRPKTSIRRCRIIGIGAFDSTPGSCPARTRWHRCASRAGNRRWPSPNTGQGP
jgi:hypothetical protein